MEWQISTEKQILAALAKRLKAFRIRKQFTQKELAEKSGVSLATIQKIEQGKSVSLHLLLSVLRSLKLLANLETLVPDVSISPIELLKQQGTKKQRVRKKKNE
jgi:putative transcriptional regulator